MVFGRSIFRMLQQLNGNKKHHPNSIGTAKSNTFFRRKSITIFCGQMCFFYHVAIKQSKMQCSCFIFVGGRFGIIVASVGTIELCSSFRL